MSSPLAGMSVSIDAQTINDSLRRRIRSIDASGSLVYAKQRNPSEKRTDDLERIWNEYPSGLLELSEEELAAAPPNTRYDDDQADEVKEEKKQITDGAGTMTSEQMEALRSEVFANLNTARNELWYALEMAKTLSLSSGFTNNPPVEPGSNRKPNSKRPAVPTITPSSTDAPILPAGTYSTTPAAPPTRSQVQEAVELDAAVQGKKRALDECTTMIDAAIDELELMAAAGERFWTDVRGLRDGMGSSGRARGQWAVLPKPDFGRSMTEGEKAKDVIIPYALDEAPPSLRARSLAAFDLDPNKVDSLTFGARSHLRLRVTLTSAAGTLLQSSRVYDARGEDGKDVFGLIQAAQRETIDEELFNEIRGEAVRLENAVVEERRVSLKVGQEELVFEMYDSTHPPSATSPTATCDLVLASARLGLLHQHRRRKARIISPPASGTPVAPTSILLPIIQTVLFHACCARLQPVLEMLAATLERAGISARVDTMFSPGDESGQDVVRSMLSGGGRIDGLGAVITLRIEECPGITLNVTAPSSVSVTTSVATFPLKDSDYMPVALADDIGSQLTRRALAVLQDSAKDDVRQHIVFDDLEGTVLVSSHGTMAVTIPPPFDRVTVDGDHSLGIYDRQSDQGLVSWLQEVAGRIPTP